MARFFASVMDGSFLTRDATLKNAPFALFLALIAGFYIANTYNAERTLRETDRIIKEMKELRSEHISLKSELMFLSTQSRVAELVEPLELKEAKEPPYKIYVAADGTSTEKE